MSKVLKVENGNYTIKVEAGGNIILDTARGTNTGSPAKPAGTVIVRGSLEVEGTTTTVESNDTLLNDNIITINNGETSAGISATKNYEAGIEIDRGSLPTGKILFDEQINWTLGATSGFGTFKFVDTATGLLPINVRGIKSPGTLFIDTGNEVISVTNTTDYEEGIFTYTGGVVADTDLDGIVVIDDDNIPNTKAVVDYFTYAISALGTSSLIAENDTKIEVYDFQTTGTPSKAEVEIDGTVRLAVFENRVEFDSIKIEGNKITTVDSNIDLELDAAGTGSVIVNDILQLNETPGVDDATVDPTAPLEGLKLYSKTQGTGKTGLFFINKSSNSGELISKNKALALSMIF